MKKLIFSLAALLLIVVSGFVYRCCAGQALDKEIAHTPRDRDSGIVLGTEPLTLEGDGDRACLFVHGWLGSRTDFHDLPERLHAAGWTVRMMLLPGHGTLPTDLEGMGPEVWLEGVRSEFLALKKTHAQVSVVGFSLGGALATLLASREEVDRLVLAAPFYEVTYRFYYVLPPEVWNDLASPFIDYVIKDKDHVMVNREEAKEHIFSYHVIPTDSVDALEEAGTMAADPEVLKRITCPVLLLYSSGDLAASPEAMEEAFAFIGSEDKESVRFERSNHHLFWDHDTDEVMRRVMSFLK